MKIKLDENLPTELVTLLAGRGHDVHTVPGERLVGHDDSDIFNAAYTEGRLLITQDLDFSDIRKFKPGTHPGIVLVRLREPGRRRLLARLLSRSNHGRVASSSSATASSACHGCNIFPSFPKRPPVAQPAI